MKLSEPTSEQLSFLIAEIKKIRKLYEDIGCECHELYTLMSAVSFENNILYSLKLHHQIMAGEQFYTNSYLK